MDHQGSHIPGLDYRGAAHATDELLVGGHGGIAGVRVKRLALIGIIKLALADLHDRRRRSDSYPQVERLEEQIKCWEDTLAWLKELPGCHVSLQGEDLPQSC